MAAWRNFLKSFWQKYFLMFLSGIISAIICFSAIYSFFCRNYAIGMIKTQFEELEKNLQSIGYDFAYDEVRFYSFSPWQIMRVKNFKIYSLDEKDFWQLTIDDLNIDVGLWDIETVDIFLGNKQVVQRNDKEWPIFVSKIEAQMRLKKGAFKEFALKALDADVKNLMTIDSVFFQLKHQKTPYASAKLDVKGITIDDMTGWPMNKLIDHFYLDTYLQGDWDKDVLISEAFYDWQDKGGSIVLQKGILNWKPLIMVANGDVVFNENTDVTVSLNTASLAMIETLDKLNENGFISNKGAFVVKILLNNKAQKTTDKYKMVVSPLKINDKHVYLENIKIK